MALRLANKINRQIVKNVCRSLSAKRDPELEPIVQKVDEVPKAVDASLQTLPLNGATIAAQYEVCRPRTTPITPYPHSVQNETDVAKKTVALQHLQPSMLPEYYKPPVEINSACMYFDPITETDRQATTKYRQFEQSKTCKNVTLPLRAPKLASPFPEPVKVMPSHTVSDQEKAEQMLAESKIMKGHSDKSKKHRQPSIRSLPSNRSYSTNNPKCGKKAPPGKKICPRVKVPGCRPVKTIKCGRAKKERPTCLRKPPPYPSYSETCHEEPYNRPSECKTCPYRQDEHPHFKPPKQDFHTSTLHFRKKKEECNEPRGQDKKPCGWQTENQSQKSQRQQQEKKQKEQQEKKQKEQPKKKAMTNISENVTEKIELSEHNRTFDFRTKNFPFLVAKTKEQKKQKKAQTNQKEAISSKAKQLSSVTLGDEVGTWLNQLQPEDIFSATSGILVSDAEQEHKGKCVKFPFKECTFTIVKERKERPVYQRCPPKPKRKLTNDCPPDKDDDKCKRSTSMSDVLTYFMSDEPANDNEKPKKKCPRVNVGICKEPHEYKDDPCKRKRTGKTLICPNDLLTKKQRPKKKTSPVIPFAQIPGASKSDTTIKI